MRRRLQFKVDTGSPYTIIGVDLLKSKGIIIDEKLLQNKYPTDLRNASDDPVNITQYTVQSFQLTDEILFKTVKIYISSELKHRAVLGMDILSLFDFQYKHEKGNMLGTFWINNWKEHMEKIYSILQKKHLDCLDTKQIFLLDEVETQSNHVANLQVLEATLIHNKLTEGK